MFVVITAFVLVILVYIFYKLKTGNSKERSQSLSGEYITVLIYIIITVWRVYLRISLKGGGGKC